MNAKYWDNKVEWLKAIRTGWFNVDYIEFLVEKVWKIHKPVNIIDFGCGFGYVGLILLPILPKGSTYTGIDISDNLLNEAKNIFANSDYKTTFVKEDLNNYIPNKKYDIAISQAVLRHIPNAKFILEKMIQSVASGGLVICMETDMEMEKAGQYFSGLDYSELGKIPLMQKMWKKELNSGGRDYRFGIKIPSLMQEFGLHNVRVRMSDSVYFINPYGDKSEHSKQYDAITSAWGWNKKLSEEEKKAYIKYLEDKGLDGQEAEMYVSSEQKISEYVMNNKDNAFIIKAPCTLISFGIK
ncbi:methyltransferase domain-containing protein [Lutispora saccharofermentans]|uniref:Class I SAM-dependent methyltransferase n=1 Tax=Lutispora saccharofermentans TaxID=3024236 RepID=A0ABT1NJJ3_9FIRM|nr:methyltransferase domain-containing protein [Lutispora saccharofermentans]MCQ1530056.1 class I SAM-dependent methyltransferase [Lutispora saccharofermentans]